MSLKLNQIFFADVGSFQFTFHYLPHFSVVCASVSSVHVDSIPDDQLSAHLDKTCLLHCLMADSEHSYKRADSHHSSNSLMGVLLVSATLMGPFSVR